MANNDPWGVSTNGSEISSGKNIFNDFDLRMTDVLPLHIFIKLIN